MAGFLPPAIFEIKAIADQAIAKFGDVNKELDKMGKNADEAGGKISGIDKASKYATAGLLAVGAAFAGFAAYGIKEAIEAEVAMKSLGVTMANAGVNTAENRKRVEELTSAYIDLGFADEEAAAGFNTLLRATGDVDKAQQLLALSADFARTKNISLSQASSVLAKAQAGNLKAFKEMGITLDETLPKSEAIAKAFDQLQEKIGGQAVGYTKTFAGQMAVMKTQFSETAETLGTALMPILSKAMKAIQDGVEFVKRNASAFKLWGGILLTVAIALASYNAYIKISMALTKAWTAITTIHKTITAMMTGQQLALNAAMTVNPIGLIVAAAVLLIGALVILWNKSETFRKIMIQIGKAGLTALGGLLQLMGLYATSVLKVVTGPLKLLLKGLALLGVGGAKEALKGIETATKGVGDFFDSAAKKVTAMAKDLDKLNKPIKIPIDFSGGGIPELPNSTGGGTTGGGTTGGNTAKAKEEQKKNNESYMKTIADLQDKVVEAKTKFTEKMADLEKSYNEDVTKLNKDASEKISQLETKAAQERIKIATERDKKIKQAQETFNNTMGKLNEKKAEDLAKIEIDNAKRIAEITQAGQDTLLSIVRQSVDRLRDAFKKGTEFNVGDIFEGLKEAGTQSADGLLAALKKRLTAAKDLAANAARLQGLGFSQTFIEQVVAAGPEVGNSMAQSILEANPATVDELKNTFVDLEGVTNTGLDRVAEAMNSGGSLATAELNKAYAQAKIDTQNMLQEQTKAFANAQAEVSKQFAKDMADAENTRDTAIAEAHTAYAEAIAAVNQDLQDSIAEVKKDLADALAEAAASLAEAQSEARKELSDDLSAIQKDFEEKLGKINDATKATVAAIAALKSAIASANAMTISVGSGGGGGGGGGGGVVVTPVKPAVTPIPSFATAGAKGYEGMTQAQVNAELARERGNVSVTVNTTNATSPAAIATSVVNEIKFGTVNTTTLAGIMAASGSSSNTTSTGYSGGRGGSRILVD